jgi:hypothetical protein
MKNRTQPNVVVNPDLSPCPPGGEEIMTQGVSEHALALSRARSEEGLMRRMASPWAVAGVVAVVYAVMIAPGLAKDPKQFIHIGHRFLTKSTTSTVIKPSLGYENKVGYDGQFYYFVAVDPTRARDYLDSPGIVYSRIGYPALARGLSAGKASAVPYMMILINFAAAVGGTLAVAFLLRRRGLPPPVAFLYGLYPGLIFSVLRDLTEPLAWALAAAGLLVFDPRSKRRLLLSAGLFALAMLTRETVALFPAILTLSLLLRAETASRWRARIRANFWTAASFGAISLTPLFAWRLFLSFWLGSQTQEQAGSNAAVPFHGLAFQGASTGSRVLILLTVVLPALLSAGLAAVALRRKMNAGLWLVLANVGVFVVFLPGPVFIDYGAAGRAAIGALLATLVALPTWVALGVNPKLVRWSLVLWSLPYWLALALLVVIVPWLIP